MSAIPALRRQRQELSRLEASLGDIAKSCLEEEEKKEKRNIYRIE